MDGGGRRGWGGVGRKLRPSYPSGSPRRQGVPRTCDTCSQGPAVELSVSMPGPGLIPKESCRRAAATAVQ